MKVDRTYFPKIITIIILIALNISVESGKIITSEDGSNK